MRVAINATSLLIPQTGIGRYTRHLVEELSETGEVEFEFFNGLGWSSTPIGVGGPGDSAPPSLYARLRKLAKHALPYRYAIAELVRGSVFHAGICKRAVDLYHEPNFIPYRFNGPTLITVHDLSVITHPGLHPEDRVKAIGRKLEQAINRADAIITVSNRVRDELLATFPVESERVHAIPNGVSASYVVQSSDVLGRTLGQYGLRPGGYVLHVGTIEPRKNINRLIDAYRRLPNHLQDEYPLVLVGGLGWGYEAVLDKLQGTDGANIRWLNHVPEEHLPALYGGAATMAYCSLYEGFGLPVLEAMASGTPVITSRDTVMEEVATDSAIFVDPCDVDEISAGLEKVLGSESLREELRSAGLSRATAYSWQRTARMTLDVYRRVAGVGPA